jgi:hypothetical protein
MEKPLPRFKAYDYDPELRLAHQVGELSLDSLQLQGLFWQFCLTQNTAPDLSALL